ncbi:MAG TPA: hypothetical protein ENH26_00135 [Candidatus Wolfebacteria bacterium]|nr:hypothetical protein [Candidatus Wolfebacteria bacterium]
MVTFFSILKIIITVLLAGLLTGILVLFVKSFHFGPKIRIFHAMNFAKESKVSDSRYQEIMRHREIIRRKWEKLLEKIKSGDERDLRLAIIEADNLVDEILIRHGYSGKDMGERLKSIHPSEIENLDDLWKAHKIRNRIAHESEFHIAQVEAKKIITVYHKTLKDLTSKDLELV